MPTPTLSPLRRALLAAAALAPLGCAAPGPAPAPAASAAPPPRPAPTLEPLNLLAAALIGTWRGDLELAAPPARNPVEVEIDRVPRSSWLSFDYLRQDAAGNQTLIAERVHVDFLLRAWRVEVPATGDRYGFALARVDRTEAPLRYDIELRGEERGGAGGELRQTLVVTADTLELVRSRRPAGSDPAAPWTLLLTYRLQRVK